MYNENRIDNLLLNVSENTTGDPIRWEGGEATFLVYGNFGGGTCSLQISPDGNATWFNVGFATDLTQDGQQSVNIGQGLYLRASLAGATDPSLTAILAGNHSR